MDSLFYGVVLLALAVIFIARTVKVVPQQSAWVVERLGKYHATLNPGLNFLMPFIDKVAYRHSLKEIPLDVPSQVCITRDNTQLQVDGILYFQVTDAMRASYGSSNYVMAITQLAQTSLRSVIGKLELDKTFEERDIINAQVVNAIDEAALNWGVKVLRYEIKDLTPPREILHAMQAQITAEREKRALIAASEGRRQEQINIATGEREAFIARSEGEKQAAINKALGEAESIKAVAQATAQASALAINVGPCINTLPPAQMPRATLPVQAVAASVSTPPVSALPQHRISGLMPAHSAANILPVRPKPVAISSNISRAPASRHNWASPRRYSG